MDQTQGAQLLTVNVVAELRPDHGRTVRPTAIDKRPVTGRIAVGPLGVAGDLQANRKYHGGLDKAVYAFAREDVAHWESRLGRPIPPGTFGENFSTVGLEVSDALVGERWRIGSGADAVVVEVTMPRTPCMTFARWMGESRWVKRFSAYGRLGAYLRVTTPGEVSPGDPVAVVHRPAHGVPVSAVFTGLEPAQARTLFEARDDGEVRLCPEVRDRVAQALGR